MAKLFTMTIFKKPHNISDWESEPSIVGKVIMCDDMRIFGYAQEYRRQRKRPAKTFYVDGTAVKREDDDKNVALGFYCLGDEYAKHAFCAPNAMFNSLSDGYYGLAETTEQNTVKVIRVGNIRIDFREYKESADAPDPTEVELKEVMDMYREISGLPPHNEELLSHAKYWRQMAIA